MFASTLRMSRLKVPVAINPETLLNPDDLFKCNPFIIILLAKAAKLGEDKL